MGFDPAPHSAVRVRFLDKATKAIIFHSACRSDIRVPEREGLISVLIMVGELIKTFAFEHMHRSNSSVVKRLSHAYLKPQRHKGE